MAESNQKWSRVKAIHSVAVVLLVCGRLLPSPLGERVAPNEVGDG